LTVTSDPSLIVARLRAAGCVFAEDEAALMIEAASGSPARLRAMLERRVAGEPLEHVLGWVDFCGLRIAVDPGVFVPRRRTEWLVAQAAALAPPEAVVVDLCCGSGALGVALAVALGGIELYAADLDPAAVRCARRNVEAVGGRVYEGDLFEPLPPELRGRVDVMMANVPYVPSDEIVLMPVEARLYEQRTALDGGPDGLNLARRVAAAAPEWLATGGHLLVETSERQLPRVVEAFTGSGLDARVAASEDNGATVVVGTLL
jgi:release factor glutamine methyltransferase